MVSISDSGEQCPIILIMKKQKELDLVKDRPSKDTDKIVSSIVNQVLKKKNKLLQIENMKSEKILLTQ